VGALLARIIDRGQRVIHVTALWSGGHARRLAGPTTGEVSINSTTTYCGAASLAAAVDRTVSWRHDLRSPASDRPCRRLLHVAVLVNN